MNTKKKRIECKVPSCIRIARKRNLCETHYERLRRYGDVREFDPIKISRRYVVCKVPSCDRPHVAKGLCRAHYMRFQKHGDIMADIPIRTQAPNGSGSIDVNGYHIISINNRRTSTHRLLMEKHLGRKLFPDETVHHINGDRQDNSIDNLELWSSSHPAGQRVEDKLAWAHELIERYQND